MKVKKYYFIFAFFSILLINSCENTVPNAPSDLVADAVTGATFVLGWTDNSNNERSFHVQKSVNEDFSDCVILGTSSNVRSRRDTDLDPETLFYYRVAAVNKAGMSEWSNNVSARINDQPPE